MWVYGRAGGRLHLLLMGVYLTSLSARKVITEMQASHALLPGRREMEEYRGRKTVLFDLYSYLLLNRCSALKLPNASE